MTQNKGYYAAQGHRYRYQSKACIRLPINDLGPVETLCTPTLTENVILKSVLLSCFAISNYTKRIATGSQRRPIH